jgi:hypothetical protein
MSDVTTTEFVASVYAENSRWKMSTRHNVTVRLKRFDVPLDEASFDADNFPYLRVALVDVYLDREIE